ncbi:MAG: hypothetical protein U0359_29825 [Byssovorax sp.]
MIPSPRTLLAAGCLFAFGCGGVDATTTSSSTSTSSTTTSGGGSTSVATTTSGGQGGEGGQGGGGGATTVTTTTSVTTGSGGAGGGGGAGGSGGTGPWSGPLQALEELDLGTQTLNVQHLFPIPDHTLGFTVLVSSTGINDVIGINRLRPPVGASVIFNFAMAGHNLQVFGNQGWVAGSDPQADSADAYPVLPGNWKLILGNDGSPSNGAHVSVWVRRTEDGQFHGGQLDFNVFIAPGVTDENYVKQVLNNIFLVSYGGIAIGNITTYPLAAAYTVVDDRAEYRTMIASTAGVGTRPSVNLFVIKDFSDADFGGAIGVAAGVPGAAMQPGTTLSGVAYQPTGDAMYDASVLRHEIGHLAGLFHTTEFQVTETDPLSDTPECDHATITTTPDACPDKTNTMFPIAYGATALTLGQVHVLQGSALYRGVIAEGGPAAPPFASPPAPLHPGMSAGPIAPADPALLARHPRKAFPLAPDPLVRMLGGVWCTHSAADYPGLAIQIAGREGRGAPALLRAVVLDASLPELIRARALAAHVRASSASKAALDLAASFAADEQASSDLRASAFAALRAHDRPRAQLLGRAAERSGDPIVRAIANILRAR